MTALVQFDSSLCDGKKASQDIVVELFNQESLVEGQKSTVWGYDLFRKLPSPFLRSHNFSKFCFESLRFLGHIHLPCSLSPKLPLRPFFFWRIKPIWLLLPGVV